MNKLLVGVDGSVPSIKAAREALKLAEALHGSLTLVHAQYPTVLQAPMGLMPMVPAEDLRAADLAAGAAILTAAAKELGRPELPVLNLLGAPADQIADAAEHGFDMVVVGNTGRGAVARMFVGSVADRLVHICKKPVLVVR
jgi:nucleotide-binding universal stress UspA family protein